MQIIDRHLTGRTPHMSAMLSQHEPRRGLLTVARCGNPATKITDQPQRRSGCQEQKNNPESLLLNACKCQPLTAKKC